MSAARFLVTTSIQGRSRHQVWNSGAELRLGWNLGWTLTDDAGGAKLIADGGGSELKIERAKLVAPLKVRVQPAGSRGVDCIVEIKPLKVIRPGYIPEKNIEAETSALRLYSFCGLRSWFLSATQVQAAYIGYSRGRPVFSVRLGPDSAEIKCLLPGLKIKMSGTQPLPGEVGEKWTVKRDKLPTVTLMRGLYWWRFHWFRPDQPADASDLLESIPEIRARKQDTQFLINLGVAVGLTAAVIGALYQFGGRFMPSKAPIEVEIAQPPMILEKMESVKVEEKTVPVPEPVKVVRVAEEAIPEPPKPKPIPKKAPAPQLLKKIPPVPKPGNTAEAQSRALVASYANILGAMGKKVTPLTGGAPVISLNNKSSAGGMGMGALKKAAIPVESSQVGSLGGHASGAGYATGAGDRVKVRGQGQAVLDGAGESATVAAGLRREEVAQVIKDHIKEVRFCHEMAMTKQAKVEGRIVIDFTIDSTGTVGATQVSESTLKAPDLEQCLMKRLLSWRFPKPKNMPKVSVQYPFEFRMLAVD